MKTFIKSLVLISCILIVEKSYAQNLDLFNKVWRLDSIVEPYLEEASFYYPPSNQEVEEVLLTFFDHGNDTYSLETSVCHTSSATISIQPGDGSGFLIETSSFNFSSCDLEENDSFNNRYIGYFTENGNHINDSFIYDVYNNNSGEEILQLINIEGNLAFFTLHDILNVDSFTSTSINLYPNPSTEKVIIEANGFILKKPKLYTLQGRQIEVDFVQEGNNRLSFSVTNLASGTYLLQLQSEQGEKITKKLVVE